MALTAISLHKKHRFTPDSDPDKGTDQATVFVLRELDSFQVAYLTDALAEMTTNATGETEFAVSDFSTVALQATQLAVVEIENFHDETGAAVTAQTRKKNIKGRTYDVLSDDVVRTIPLPVAVEIYGHIQAMNTVKDDEAKN